MNEIAIAKKIARWSAEKWKTTVGCIIALVVAFLLGSTFKEKSITDDCKFVGAFRDGAQGYTCSLRVRGAL